MTEERSRTNVVWIGMIVLFFVPSVYGQDSTDAAGQDKFGWLAYPYIFSSPETSLAFGVGAFIYFRPYSDSTIKPCSITPSFYYTINDQYDVTIKPEFYIGKEYYVYSDFSFGRYVDKYYGIGPETQEIDNPEYDHETFAIQLDAQKQFTSSMRAGVRVDYLSRTITDKRQNPFLSDPNLAGHDGGSSLGFGLLAGNDSRDNRFYPTSGILNEFSAVYYSKAWGSDFDYNVYTVDLRGYHNLGEEHPHILGMQFFGTWASSGAPFYDLALLGSGTIMRGYYQGRYRDHAYVAAQMEYRTMLFWRIGAVTFAGVGEVVPALKDTKLKNLLPNYGFGLRYLFDIVERLDIRMDFGFGRGTSGVYFDIQQAF